MFWEIFYDLCISKGLKPNPLGKQIGVSSSTITQWKQGSVPSGDTLAKIADYFDCSVDYLLGRTDNPNSHKLRSADGETSINNSDAPKLDEHQKLLIELYNKLSPIKQVELIASLNNEKS